MLNTIIPGTQSFSLDVFIQDPSGAPRTGLAFNTAGLKAYYRRGGNGAATAITLATLANAVAAYSSGGFVEIDSSNMPGWYRLDVPNAAIDVGADSVAIVLSGASTMTPCNARLALKGLTNELRVNKAQAGAAGSITLDSGASSTDDLYNRNVITIVRGTGAGQSRYISDYVGSSKVASVTPNWVTNPDTSSVFSITSYGLDSVALDTLIDAIWDEQRSGHVLSDTFGGLFQALNDGTAQAGGAGTITLAAAASAVDSFYNGAILQIISGTGAGQFRQIASYVGSTRVATIVGSWSTQPNNTSRYLLHTSQAVIDVSAASVDAILDDAIPDATGVPASFTLRNAIGWLASLAAFKQTQTATTGKLRNRVDGADVATRTISDDGTTGIFGKWS